MKRQQQALSPGMPKSLQPGHYLSWQQRIYRVTALDPQQPLVIHVETIPGGERVQLALTTLFAAPQTGQDTPLFATSLEALDAQLAQRAVPLSEADPDELPASFLVKAQIIVQTVDMVSRLVQEDERRARGRREAWSRTQAVRRALATCEGAVIRVQMKDTSSEHILHPTFSTYYKYERLYRTCGGDCTRIAASFRRSTFRTSRLSRAQLHFSEMCLVLYYGNTRVTKTRAYQLARETLDHRTHGYWIDPERCGKVVPENLVTELLDPAIPMQALLDNPEKAALLTRITMPSRAWFCGYATYLEATADTGQQLMNQRLGQGVWEQYHLVFETFVHRAGLPLQYVFADHWLVNAWIVDEETRSQASRLWLTLLIDAYSRSIVGMALLSEEPCIESIQSALRHAIWHKSSHARLGLDGEWSCYGIPQQLFLDNAWAHHSHSLEHLARAISRDGVYNAIDLVFRPPYKGRYGAIIERVFRNFSGQIKELVAGAMASKSPQEVRAAAGRAWLLHTDLDRLLHQLILTYQHTPHRELNGMTPHQKWCEGIQTSGLPLIPAFTPEMDRLFLRLHPQTRQVRSRGIPAFGLNYWSAELGGIARRASDGSPVRYHFRYDPTDISRISLFRDGIWAGDGHARELQRADGTYRQVSLAEWQMAKRQVASRALDAEGKTPAELVLVTDLEVLSKQRAQEKRATQRNTRRKLTPTRRRSACCASSTTEKGGHCMTTELLDESLDVRKRLEHLRAWQAEWSRIDRLLEEQLLQLDGNKPLEVQQANHIATLRRRMEMTLAQTPLSIPEEVIRRLGARLIREQLAQQFASLTKEERLLWLNSFTFFLTADLRRLDDKIAKVRAYRSLGQSRNFLLGGESGMGKTTYLDWLLFNHLPVVEQERNRVPIIGIQAPVSQQTARPLLWRMVLECGHTFVTRDNEEILLMKLVLYVQQCGVELIVIDEIQHITRPELKRRVLEISNMTRGIPIVCASCHPIQWTEGDEEIKGRWNDFFQLKQYTGARLDGLLSTIELFLPFSQDSHLSARGNEGGPGPAELIEQWTGGILRDIMILIRDACRRAIEEQAPSLQQPVLEATWKDVQTKQVTDFLDLIRQRARR